MISVTGSSSGQRVGRRDDRPQRECRGPGQPGDQRVRDRRDGDHGHQDQHHRRQRDRPRVAAQVRRWREEGRPVQQRRQEQHQHQVGWQLHGRDPWHEPEQESAEDEQDRVRHPDHAGQDAQCPHCHHQDQQQELGILHAITSPAVAAGMVPARSGPPGGSSEGRWSAAVTLAGDGCLSVERSYGAGCSPSAIRRGAGDARVSPLRLLLLGGVGLVTGVINTVAGGGSLLSFPALLALGYSPLVANVTNTIGVFPSSAGGSVGYRRELVGQARSWMLLAAICTVGSLIGAWLLLVLPASSFEAAVPVLIATAAVLTLVQPWLARRMPGPNRNRPVAVGAGAPAAGAPAASEPAPEPAPLNRRWGLPLIVLFLHETLQRVNALKTSLTAVVNGVVAVAFAFLGPVVWSAAVVLAGTTMVGGMLGAVVARRLSDRALRWAVVVIGLAAAVYSAVR